MAEISVQKAAISSVTLVLSEEEALYVLGVLGHSTGITPDTYSELFVALSGAGISKERLRDATSRYQVF